MSLKFPLKKVDFIGNCKLINQVKLFLVSLKNSNFLKVKEHKPINKVKDTEAAIYVSDIRLWKHKKANKKQ